MATKEPKPWPQRPYFRHLVDAWLVTTGKTKRELAEAAEIEPGSLKQYYSGVQIPGRDLALRLARVLGCQISDLLGEPTSVNDQEPRDEVFGNIMSILGKNLSDAQKKAMIEMAKAGQAVGREREAAEKKAPSGKR